MNTLPLIEPGSAIGRELARAAREKRFIFFAGLPGVGKSLMIQQCALFAEGAGRRVHLVRWDVVRTAFESHPAAARFGESAGQTHPVIRAAASAWVRAAIGRWHAGHPDSADLLLGETPLLGNRFATLARCIADPVECLLDSSATEFFLPVPSIAVRQGIQRSRQRETAQPRHELERANADPNLLTELWGEVERASASIGETGTEYLPEVYAALFSRVLHARRHTTLQIDELFSVKASAQELGDIAGELVPTGPEVLAALSEVDSLGPGMPERMVNEWFLA